MKFRYLSCICLHAFFIHIFMHAQQSCGARGLFSSMVSNGNIFLISVHAQIQRGMGETGDLDPPPPPKKKKKTNTKIKGFLSNTGPDPLKIAKLPSQHSMMGRHLPASDDGPLIVLFGSSLPSYKKNVVRVGHPLAKLDLRMLCENI